MNNSVSELYGHLDELRKRLTVIAVANIGAMMLLFSQASRVIDYFLKINPGMQLVYITPSELLVVYVQLSFVMAAIVCSPITGYEIWAFVEKGLYSREKKYILITLVFGVICFAAGVVFCYYLVLPTTLRFFIRIAITEVESMISIKSYISFISTMLLSFGAVFEMPVLVFLLKPSFLKANRGIIIVGIFVFAAVITPPDVVSQLMLGLPMVALFQLSLGICTLVDRSNSRKKAAQADAIS